MAVKHLDGLHQLGRFQQGELLAQRYGTSTRTLDPGLWHFELGESMDPYPGYPGYPVICCQVEKIPTDPNSNYNIL